MTLLQRNITRELAIIYCSLFAGLLLVVTTGLVTDVGCWYEGDPIFDHAYRKQTEAFFHGRVALAENPGAVIHDYCWVNGKVQQVWGLGIPAWRFIFEAFGRLLGQDAFPDRIAFLFAYSVTSYVVFKAVFDSCDTTRLESVGVVPLTGRLKSIGAMLIILAFPPFVTLCRTRFMVFEEAAAYAYLYAIGLFSGLLIFANKRSFVIYIALAGLCGLAPFVRPTLIFYGGATMVLAFWLAGKMRFGRTKLAFGVSFYIAGLSLLFLTNWQRFGSPMEFGHSLNFSQADMAYSTRFDNPFRKEPLSTAGIEVIGALFGDTDFNGFDWYRRHIFPGQSSSPRWREFYIPTFGTLCAALLSLAWICGFFAWKKKKKHFNRTSLAGLSVLWSTFPTLPLFVFYMHSPGLTSRYTMDFAPAFAVAIMGLWMRIVSIQSIRSKPLNVIGLGTLLALYFGYEIVAAKIEVGHSLRNTTTYRYMITNLRQNKPKVETLPAEYRLGTDLNEFGIFGNGDGWDTHNGQAHAIVMVFVKDPEDIAVDVVPIKNRRITTNYLGSIRAKIGLEALSRVSVSTNAIGATIVFESPRKTINKQGFQVLFLSLMAPEEVGRQELSDLLLTRIRWRSQPDILSVK